jgi:tetratricopeptide (TPR) repeat protein
VRERQGRNAEAVAGLLDQCEEALRGGDTRRAAVTLEAAQKRAAEGGAEASAARLDALAADLALLRDLDAIDQVRWTSIDRNPYDRAALAASYREALGRFGADPDAVSPEAAAARASGSVVRERITSAWDWMLFGEKRDWVRAALQIIDADPYREAVRDAVLTPGKDWKTFVELVARPEALEQSPEFTAFVGDIARLLLPARDRALRLLEAAVSRRPGNLALLMSLAVTEPLNHEQFLSDRLRWCQAAVAAGPTSPIAHSNLADVLREKKDLAGAEAAGREAIRLDPTFVWSHRGLAVTLRARGDLAGAEGAAREIIRLRPTSGLGYIELGHVLWERKDLAGAEAAYREAIRLSPKDGWAHISLGDLLYEQKDLASAEAAYREAIRVRPTLAGAHNGLGNVLRDRNDLAGAEAAYREAIRLDPKLINARGPLGWLLWQKGDLDGAVAEFKEVLRLVPKDAYALANLPKTERMRELLPRLPDVLDGKAEPATPIEACAFAELCALPFQKRYAAAARLFERAFVADPKLAADLNAYYRYNAACYAVRAAVGDGIDPPADGAARTALRQKALGWLRSHLALWRKQAASADAAQRGEAVRLMSWWLEDSDLSAVRDPEPLAKLPAAERSEWEKFWADVKSTLADAHKPVPPAGK